MKLLHVFGATVGYPLDTSGFTGDFETDRASSYVQSLVEGCAVDVDSNGNIQVASAGTAGEGLLLMDASGGSYENVPALASERVAVLVGGGIVETDYVVEDTIVAGDTLYIGANGKLTKTDGGTYVAVGKALSANSSSNLTIKVRLF